MPREYSRWQGFRIILDGDGKGQLVVDDSETLSQTIGTLHGTGYFDVSVPGGQAGQADERRPIGNWIITEVVTRGTNIWPRASFALDGPLSNDMWAVNGNVTNLKRLLVGYSPYTLHPVFANPPKANTVTDGTTLDDSLRTLRYRSILGEKIVGANAILHHSLAIPGNIVACKKILIRQDWEGAFRDGDIDVNAAKDLAAKSCTALHEGDSPVVLARIAPRLVSRMSNSRRPNLNSLEDPSREEGPANRF